MTFDELKTLINAGMTEEQIRTVNAMMSPAPAPAPATLPPTPNVPTSTPTETGAAAGQPTDAAASAESETQRMVREMLGIMQKGMINNISKETPPPTAAEDVLATIITP